MSFGLDAYYTFIAVSADVSKLVYSLMKHNDIEVLVVRNTYLGDYHYEAHLNVYSFYAFLAAS